MGCRPKWTRSRAPRLSFVSSDSKGAVRRGIVRALRACMSAQRSNDAGPTAQGAVRARRASGRGGGPRAGSADSLLLCRLYEVEELPDPLVHVVGAEGELPDVVASGRSG